ncbi:MAG: peptidoglycan synthetase [Bacteroidetes bacterium]|nr:peptidoglycan synthetase [Bacteroidota bacterium]
MHLHFIAIGGSAMHNLAIALHLKGYRITGSDDEIFEPSKTRLNKYNLLPKTIGWDASRIHKGIDAVILGMHAKEDNPELLRAKELGLQIFSYPEYLYEQSQAKTRVVIGGSHGKTTITAMILHVLNYYDIDTDYMVGAQLDGFDVMVKLSYDAPFMILEGDEYLSSPIDKRPKFHLYKPNIALISGIAWDHINVFPTFDIYVDQFRKFINVIEPDNGKLIYCSDDNEVNKLCSEFKNSNIELLPYGLPDFSIENDKTIVIEGKNKYELSVFGKHNLLNMNGARLVCNQLGIDDEDFYKAIQSYKGASKRLEMIYNYGSTIAFKDFAHAPSKIKATTEAVKEQFPSKKIIACMELHTYSSLNKEFLKHYNGALEKADYAFVYYNPHTLEIKKLPAVEPAYIYESFNKKDLEVFTNSELLFNKIKQLSLKNTCLLFMSSGSFDGIDLAKFVKELKF